ncbi:MULTISPECIES: transposase, partial [Helcococcus]
LEDILIISSDNLPGISQAIEAVFPKTEIQKCIIHQIRNSTKFVSYKDLKDLMKDLKMVYQAKNEKTALQNLENFEEKWAKKYP